MREKRPAATNHQDLTELRTARRERDSIVRAQAAPSETILKAKRGSQLLTPRDALHLQQWIGNRTLTGIINKNQPQHDSAALLQRTEVSNEQAQKVLSKYPEFKNNQIIRIWDDDWKVNCHAYTLHGVPEKFTENLINMKNVKPLEFLQSYIDTPKEGVMVFVKGTEIGHSGKLAKDGTLHHLLMGAGLLKSNVGDHSENYDKVFTLPEDLGGLLKLISPEAEKNSFMLQVSSMADNVTNAINELGLKEFKLEESKTKSLEDLYEELKNFEEKIEEEGVSNLGEFPCIQNYNKFWKDLSEEQKGLLISKQQSQ